MKKKVICVFLALLLSLSFCACGMDRTTQEIEVRPGTAAPNGEDGVVQDKDGIIGNESAGTVSPSPAPTSMPEPSPKATTQPTTAPSATPKP